MVDLAFETSPGENLFLKRRRKNWNQTEAANNFGVSIDLYAEWETDAVERGLPTAATYPPAGITDAEKCVILRRRAGVLQREVAQKIGCSRLWVIKMENGQAPVQRLREHWGV